MCAVSWFSFRNRGNRRFWCRESRWNGARKKNARRVMSEIAETKVASAARLCARERVRVPPDVITAITIREDPLRPPHRLLCPGMNASKPPTPVPPTAVAKSWRPWLFLPLPPFPPPPPPPPAGPGAPHRRRGRPSRARAVAHTSHCALAAWFRNVHEGQSQVFDDEAEDDSRAPARFRRRG